MKKPALYLSITLLIILFAWIIWGTYKADNLGFDKTLWEWMELLLVPAALAAASVWFAQVQKNEDRETAKKARELDREIALERQSQQTLENYLDRMKELLLDRGLGIDAEVEVKRLARTLTLNVLRELDGTRNSQIIQFLQESELIGGTEVVDLKRAKLMDAKLMDANLSEADLSGANLSGGPT